MTTDLPFSKRLGISPPASPMLPRDELPGYVRSGISDILTNYFSGPADIVNIIKKKIRKHSSHLMQNLYHSSFSELIMEVPWYLILESIEDAYMTKLHRSSMCYFLDSMDDSEISEANKEKGFKEYMRFGDQVFNVVRSELLAAEINEFFFAQGVPWLLVEGRFRHREEGPVEQVAKILLEGGTENYPTVMSELREAWADISRRPDSDITGAIQHSAAALECMAKQHFGQPNKTLGAIIAENRSQFPKPIDEMLEKAWGFASNQGRHLTEGAKVDAAEAELLVGLSSVMVNYLLKRSR